MPVATSHELIVTIVKMLAEAADRSRLTNADQDLLNKKVEELMAYDSDESVEWKFRLNRFKNQKNLRTIVHERE